jgi:hypothetical protein
MHDSSYQPDDPSAVLPSPVEPDRSGIADELFRLAGLAVRLSAHVKSSRRKKHLLEVIVSLPRVCTFAGALITNESDRRLK